MSSTAKQTAIARTLIGATEGDRISVSLTSDDALIGPILDEEHELPGDYFDGPGRVWLRFKASGVAFELTMQYVEDDAGPVADLLDLRLVEDVNWEIPINVPIRDVRTS